MNTPEPTQFEKELNDRLNFIEKTVVIDLANCLLDLKNICSTQQKQLEELRTVGTQHQLAIEGLVQIQEQIISLN